MRKGCQRGACTGQLPSDLNRSTRLPELLDNWCRIWYRPTNRFQPIPAKVSWHDWEIT
jgi:hypothetical protein